MKKLAKKGGYFWVLFAIVPIAQLVNMIGELFCIDAIIILTIQIPAIVVQLFSMFMLLRYSKQIF